jgi:exosortase
MSNSTRTAAAVKIAEPREEALINWVRPQYLVLLALLVVIYWQPCKEMYGNWMMADSYYSHGFLVPPISLFFLWRKRHELATARIGHSAWGYPLIIGSAFMLIAGDFLGFRVFAQFSLVPMLFGLALVFLGREATRILWFPLIFLVFMVPIPPSLTQSISLKLKLFAAHVAVDLANLLTLPMVQEGSFIHFKKDQLLVGDVCGGLRSLIALFAFGAVMSYISRAKNWARVLLFAMSGPIAIISNVFRIFLLCVIGYFWGSSVASGRVHDISGILIFVVAFILFLALEGLFRRLAPAREHEETRE